MRKFTLGLFSGLVAGLILATTTFALAADQIKLIVNGKEIHSEVPPQVIGGRTLVPARPLAEALGATVAWDGANNSVIVTSQVTTQKPSNSATIEEKGVSGVTETTFNGIRAIIVDGTTYFNGRGYVDKYMTLGAAYSPSYGYDKSRKMLTYLTSDGNTIDVTDNADALYIISGFSWINAKYYREP